MTTDNTAPTPTTAPAPAPAPAAASAIAPAPRGPAQRWLRRLLWVILAILVIEGLLWLAVPPLVRWQGQKIGSEVLGRPVHIGAVRFKPWSLELTAHDLSVGGVDGGPAPLAIKRLYVNASIASLWKLAPVIDDVQIDDPAVHVTRLAPNHYDIDDILARLNKPSDSTKKPSKPPRFALYNVVLQGGSAELDDRVVGQVQKLSDLHIALPFLSDLPAAREVKVLPQLSFTLNGSAFKSHAETLPFAPSQQTEAQLTLAHFDLTPYLGYLPADLPVRVRAGVVDADLHVRFAQTPAPALHLSGTVDLTQFRADDAQGNPGIAFDALKIGLADVQPLARSFHLSSLELDQPRLAASRDKAGVINWLATEAAQKPDSDATAPAAPQAAAKAASAADTANPTNAASTANTATTSPEAAPAANAAPAPAFALDQLTLRDGTVTWADAAAGGATGAAAHLALRDLQLDASAIAYPMKTPIPFKGSAAVAESAPAAQPAQPAAAKTAEDATKAEPANTQAAASAAEAKPAAQAQAAGATLQFSGQADLTQGDVALQTQGIPLALAAPYLAPYLEPQLHGTLGADVALQWAPAKAPATTPGWSVTAKKLQLDNLELVGGTPERGARARASNLPRIAQLQLVDAQIDPQTQTVTIKQIGVKEPRIQVARDAHGRWMFEHWLRTPKAAPRAAPARHASAHGKKAPAPRPWAVRVAALDLTGGAVGWLDETTPHPVRAQVSDLHVNARDFDLEGKKPMPLDVSARIAAGARDGAPGRLAWRGTVAWAPVAARGEVDAERLPLQAFMPYADNHLNIRVERALGGFKGHIDYAATAAGPRVEVAGDARVDELRTATRPGSVVSRESKGLDKPDAPAAPRKTASSDVPQELFSARELRLDRIKVALAPKRAPQIAVGSTLLSGFFARIVINPNGRINLQDIASTDDGAQSAEQPTPTATTTPAPKPAARDPLAPVIHLGPTRFSNGHIDFTDHFIRPNYSADLTALNGSLGGFDSVSDAAAPQMAKLTLTGKAEGTAALDVEGTINPLADPLALDIHAKVTDLELPPLSPYAIKYSGHGIERGKLSMDVAYKIQPDGQLTATNKLILNQLKFGAPVEGAPASLPVELATALLANSDGVINLDIPISGSLNDPEFSLGPIIFKAVVNLIGKAITAPFTLLAHAFGGSDSGKDLSEVAFAPGSAHLDAAARTQLDRVAKALTDRAALKLTVTGEARLSAEEDGAKRQRLYALVAAEQGASEPKSEEADPAAVAASPDYPKLLTRLYRDTKIPGKPRNFIGMQRSEPVAEMEKLLMAHLPVDEATMRKLATQRGMAVKDYLTSKGVAASRLFLGTAQASKGTNESSTTGNAADTGSGATPSAGGSWTPHAQLSLGMQ